MITTGNAYCEECNENVAYAVSYRPRTDKHRGVEVEYTETVAACYKCGNEVYTAEIFDENIRALLEAFAEKYKAAKRRENNKSGDTALLDALTDKSPLNVNYYYLRCGKCDAVDQKKYGFVDTIPATFSCVQCGTEQFGMDNCFAKFNA
jgi:hypothetical protein